jgi:uncharacterized protein (UPF0276 family)
MPAVPAVSAGLALPSGSAASQVGIGLRHPHYAQLLLAPPELGFVEVHSENFFADGGAALAVLHEARGHYPVSLHGVGLALGSAAGLDTWHLDRLARLVSAIDPVRVSDHACFARVPRGGPAGEATVVHASDLLPIAFTDAALAIMVANVMRVQERLSRTLLVENLSAYVSFSDGTMTEPDFFAALCRRTGCGMLLDVNNIMVNALNEPGATRVSALGSCRAYVDALPIGIVGEIHLAGYCRTGGETGSEADGERGGEPRGLVIDDHGSRVRPDVWAVYEYALRRFGEQPTLIEWDTDLPALEVLLGEASHAAGLVARHRAACGAGVIAA